MAHKILLLPDQVKLSKSQAEMMRRRLEADWEERGVSIRRRPVSQIHILHLQTVARFSFPAKPYIPKDMPMAELPGLASDLESPQTRATIRFANFFARAQESAKAVNIS